MPAADAKYDVTTETASPALAIQRKESFPDGWPFEGTLKVTGAKTMFLLARGRFSRIGRYTLLGSESK